MATVKELRQAGRLAEALELGRAELAAASADPWKKNALSWVYFDVLKQTSHGDTAAGLSFGEALGGFCELDLPPDQPADQIKIHDLVVGQVGKYLFWVAKQPNAPADLPRVLRVVQRLRHLRPSDTHSFLVKALVKVKDKAPVGAVLWRLAVGQLQPADTEPEVFNDRKLPPLEEQVYGAIAASLTKPLLAGEAGENLRANITAFLPLLDEAISRHPRAQWLPYRKARLELLLHPGEALPVVLPVVRQKSSEFWAWHLLAETVAASDVTAAMACLYRATTCGAEEKFLGKVRLALARHLLAAGHRGEARWQLMKVDEARRAEGYNQSGESLVLQLQLADIDPSPNDQLRRDLLARAQEVAYGDLPWCPAVFDGIQADPTGDSRQDRARLLISTDSSKPLKAAVKLRRATAFLRKLALGAPVRVQLDPGAGRPQVLQVQDRPDGQHWDVVPEQIGVVSFVNTSKSLLNVAVSRASSCVVYFDQLEQVPTVTGTAIAVRLRERKGKDGAPRFDVLTARVTNDAPSPEVLRDFKGSIRVNTEKAFGFVGDLFVPPPIVQASGCTDGQLVRATAVWVYSAKKQKLDWVVVRMQPA